MLGQVVEDRYLVEAELGEGAMGRVYRARHIKLARHVALKVMHRDLARVESIVERFAREAMIAARLRHPNLASVLDVGKTPNGLPMIVLELAPGTKLSHVIDGPLSRERVTNLVAQLLRGLDHAHSAGLIHRDLKPDNILVETTPDGREIPRIVDFGIAVTCNRDDSVAGQRLTEANTVIGTPVYMSPEQARAKQLDQRTDLFSLGVIVYELLAGLPPFAGTSVDVALANASKDPPSIADRAGVHVDPLLETFARKLMARRVEDRFASAHEALHMLDLIERDRMAAARALSMVSSVAPVAPVATSPVLAANSDVLSTQPLTVIRTPRRLRAIAVSGAVLVAILGFAGWSARGVNATAPQLQLSATEHVDVTTKLVGALPAAEVAAVEAAASPVSVASPLAFAARLSAPMSRSEPKEPASAITVSMHALFNAQPMTVTPAAFTQQPVAPNLPSAADVASRYAAVGRALRGAPDALWERYRRIRINEAIASAHGRQATMQTLEHIERALR
jgi:eukaryotic-like serine/threonine-protein kinase